MNEVRFTASRKINLGASKWSIPPDLTPEAKEVLCRSVTEFHDYYGDYYVAGWTRGAMLKIDVTAVTKTKDTASSMSAYVEATFSEWGVSLEGSAGFQSALSANE